MTFFIKQDSETLTEEEMPTFLMILQKLGITLDTYNGAYRNVTHPNAVDTIAQNDQCQEQQSSAKCAKLDNGATTTITDQ